MVKLHQVLGSRLYSNIKIMTIINASFKLIFTVALLCIAMPQAFAHNVQQSSFKLLFSKEKNFLDIVLSQYGIEQAMLKAYPSFNLEESDSQRFKELLVRHIKENFQVKVNGESLVLGRGAIRLGSHQSNIRFRVNNAIDSIDTIEATVTCFSENEKQRNILKIQSDNFYERVILSESNHYTTQLAVLTEE